MGAINFKTSWLGKPAIYVESAVSTNSEFKGDFQNGTIIYTFNQIGGYGRRGNNWEFRKNEGIAMSFILKEYNLAKIGSSALPLSVGMGVCNALNDISHNSFKIKWPNDIVCNSCKISGILCEIKSKGINSDCIVGIGINVLQNKEFFLNNGLNNASSILALTGIECELNSLVEKIAFYIEKSLDIFLKDGFAPLCDDFNKLCITVGSDVKIISQNGEKSGKALKVLENGNLYVDFDGKCEEIFAGEVSVRGKDGYI